MDDAGNYPEILADMADKAGEFLQGKGIPEDIAAECGFALAEHIRAEWSGQSLYLPKGVAYNFSRRDLEIYAEFNGRNQHELAKKHEKTVMRIYQIVKRVRAEEFKRRQGALF